MTFNEIAGLKEIIGQIPEDDVEEVLAIDGGSTDGCMEYLTSIWIQVYEPDRPGKG